MQTRTLYALLAAVLVTASGAALAETSDAYAAKPTPGPADAPAYKLKISPAEAWIKGGETATFSVVAESRAEMTLTLSVRAVDGLAATLASETLDLMPGSGARTALSVAAPASATRSPLVVIVTATDADGNVREAKAAVHVREIAKRDDTRAEKPAPTDVLRQILERLDRMEKRISALEARERPTTAAAPKPASDPANGNGVRMTLSPEHAILSPEGGRVALLLVGGAEDARVALGLRYNESSGWRAALEQEHVFVPAGQRAWVWVDLVPTDAAIGPLEYAITQQNSPGPYVAKGTAAVRMA